MFPTRTPQRQQGGYQKYLAIAYDDEDAELHRENVLIGSLRMFRGEGLAFWRADDGNES